MSVRAACPECGALVGVTILARVDPRAAELAPIRRPALTAWALVAFPCFGFTAAVCVWALRGGDLVEFVADQSIAGRAMLKQVSLAFVAASGLAALAMVRPTSETPKRRSVITLGCVLLFGVFIALQHRMHFDLEMLWGRPYPPEAMTIERPILHLASTICLSLIVLGLRVPWRLFVARSRLMRSGRVDRQELNPLVYVLLIVMAGDVVMLAAGLLPDDDLAHTFGWLAMFLIGIGSMLFTVGLLTLTTDAWRLGPFIRRGAIAPKDVLGPHGSNGSNSTTRNSDAE
ncbi:MAG: hypothetical protein AAGK04_00885 [Planctomycetota bacterium]